VKFADKPDSVRLGKPRRDCHYSGPPVARTARCYLPAHSGGPVNVCLLGIAARRDCPFHPNWIGSSLLLWSSPHGGEWLTPTLPCAVRTFLQCGISAGHQRQSGKLHTLDYPCFIQDPLKL